VRLLSALFREDQYSVSIGIEVCLQAIRPSSSGAGLDEEFNREGQELLGMWGMSAPVSLSITYP